ncbi:hypothetical protein [Bradyrhizobium archetypum]|uniref:hypothetical protein n=1 Tax=Bradyrhizobium archetypum TaxID=2721160 RepID=UPI001F29CAA8|nr:hypothetical protein [Bradyrhizobium archetypum]
MSSLLLLPLLLLRQLPPKAKILVLTYDSTHCSEDLLRLDDPAERARVVIGGIEGGKFWHDGLKGPAPPVDVAAIEKDVAACITTLRAAHPGIAAILFECAAFPTVAAPTSCMAQLPVYDITDLCRMKMASTGQAGIAVSHMLDAKDFKSVCRLEQCHGLFKAGDRFSVSTRVFMKLSILGVIVRIATAAHRSDETVLGEASR